MNCHNCSVAYSDIEDIKRCRKSGLQTALIMKAEDFTIKACRYHEPFDEALVPVVVRVRFAEELKLNRLTGWRALSQLCAGLAVNAARDYPCSPLHRILISKSEEAYQRMLACQPAREEEHGIA